MNGLSSLKVAYYGDDFTGATDTLATAAHAGLRTMLFLRVPDARQLQHAGELDCLGIAGAARSMTPAEMRGELAPVANFFKQLSAPVLHYKICSTFDSSPEIGNIGVAMEAFRDVATNPLVAIVGGQPNLRRYCVFGNLFAAAGIGGELYRIDRHPTMSRHPVTPMREADLRLHLAQQGVHMSTSVDSVDYEAATQTLDDRLDAQLALQPGAVLFDVARTADLVPIGRTLWQRAQRQQLLAIGPSSVLQALAAHWVAEAHVEGVAITWPTARPTQGPVFLMAGSLSPITAQQVAAARSYQHLRVDAFRLCDGDDDYLAATATRAADLLRSGANVLAVTADAPPTSAATPSGRRAARDVATATGRLVVEVLNRAPVRRLGIAGGDTSSHAVRALDAWGLSYVAHLAEGVALCRLHADNAALDGLELMLKGGQMGPEGVFENLVHGVP